MTATIAQLSPADVVRTAQLIEHINLALLGERSAVALCALTGVLCVVVAELQSKENLPIGHTLRMLFPLLETQSENIAGMLHHRTPGHA